MEHKRKFLDDPEGGNYQCAQCGKTYAFGTDVVYRSRLTRCDYCQGLMHCEPCFRIHAPGCKIAAEWKKQLKRQPPVFIEQPPPN